MKHVYLVKSLDLNEQCTGPGKQKKEKETGKYLKTVEADIAPHP
jgi:hypothetical protein